MSRQTAERDRLWRELSEFDTKIKDNLLKQQQQQQNALKQEAPPGGEDLNNIAQQLVRKHGILGTSDILRPVKIKLVARENL